MKLYVATNAASIHEMQVFVEQFEGKWKMIQYRLRQISVRCKRKKVMSMYHGEYKVPGGKLIVVDCAIADGRLSNIQISGDFFLAPDEALAWITAALEQAPADLPEQELAERVRVATADAELLGITPEGVAIAVRRAVAGGAA